jgi:1L-myo-inositol 1-phosphate cytidylyltransferase / CDP-L-myo-inositol myo-inositolphosphotransferase
MTAAHEAARKARIERVVRWGALGVGILLFFGTLYYINFRTALGTLEHLGVALPLALLFSGLWHLARTWAWAWCFPQPRAVSFARLVRVRLSAEAFSFLTLRGIAGEPLKVVLLGDRVDPREATAAVALERIAYLIGTTLIVGVGSMLAMAGLPLSRTWFRVFRAFAIASGVIAVLTGMIVAGRGSYVQSWLMRLDRVLGTSIAQGRVSRFISAVERQMLELVRGNPLRLAVLLIATIAAYLCMALEAWVILRASGAVITPNRALAVETFSRVASFASAFIPANLGALEASSLAAVAAVGAATGGAALALARRIRGLFWAGVGLAIFPRGTRRVPVETPDSRPHPDAAPARTLLYLPYDNAVSLPPSARLAGLPLAERVLRPARRAGYARIVVWLPDGCQETNGSRLRHLARAIGGAIVVARTEAEWHDALAGLGSDEPVTAIGAGTIVSTALLEQAAEVPVVGDDVRDVPAGPDFRVSGVVRCTAATAASPAAVQAILSTHRRRAEPLPSGVDVSRGRATLALRIESAVDLAHAEETIRRSSYKMTDAKVARFNRRMSLPISIALMPTPLTANQLSMMLVALGFYSAWLFSTGHYAAGVVGAFLSLAASVLDGCDGEIARLKYQESALGCWIETFGDYSYYIAIFIGLTIGAVRQTGYEAFYWIGGLALAGTLLSFALLIYLRSRITAGQPEKLHAIARERFKAAGGSVWSKMIWRVSFVATRAAMPYGIMAFALVNALPGIVLFAALGANIYWVSIVIKLRHLLGSEEAVAA